MTNMVPAAILLAKHREIGIFNFTNPGTFTHNEVMELTKKYIRPSLTWTNFSLEEQRQVLKAPRTNAKLDASKLVNTLAGHGYAVLNAQDALVEAFTIMKAKGYQ
ncbi:hypothetical protein EYZ11_007423 [Aspergillus tanneri]|nr:hypothetical protein EYZ11_007423 [Aspergillus tanneri]